jgi:uncharacterized iron-regulated membrane protein
MSISWNRWTRKLHRWGALVACVPLLLVILTGLLLQVKKQVSWIQPPTMVGSATIPGIHWDQILDVAKSVAAADVDSWQDIDRLDVRPDKGLAKVQCKNHWEIQIDLQSGVILSSTYRRSDLIESLHDGSFFTRVTKLWIFLPSGIVLLGLWISGAYLWWLPIGVKRKKKRKQKMASTSSPNG